MKNIAKLQFLLFTLAALSLLLSIVIYSYETGYEHGYDAYQREPTVVTIRKTPQYTGDIQTQIYHGEWCSHTVDPYYAIYFDKPDVAETLGYEACIFF